MIAGSYPAFYLSSFSPVRVLKGVVDASKGKLGLRKVLVVFQFTVSIVMIIATVVVSQQQGYIRNKDLGFDKENLMVISDLDTAVSNHFNSFQEELLKHHAITDAAGSQQVLGVNNSKIVSRIEQEGEMQEIGINLIACDFQYLQTLGIRLAEGRFFDPTLRTDSTQAFIISKAAQKVFGWTGDPLGKRVQFGIRMDGSASRDGVVVGVVDDFHYTSIHNPIEPFMFFVSRGAPQALSIRFKPSEPAEAVNYVKQKFNEYNPSRDLSSFFLDQRLDQLYRAEQKLGWLFRVFSLITIFISCLGLLGLSSFVTEQRTKEIGIRKVLGGTSRDIIILLTQQFLALVLVANVFAWPLAYFAMQKWLEGFAFRIEFAQSPFHIQTLIPLVISGLIALVTAFITVGFLSWRAANSNPSNSLKYE